MQDPAGLRSMATGCGRIFGDRRLRPHPNQNLKCPRCDSPNTKFCYYNNYNLSQPRHFCKNCRRYWTKGGVLRNVPVGGGCRKAKRSKQKTSPDSQKDSPTACKSNSHSSSESSSLTATEASSSSIQQQLPEPSYIDQILGYPDSRLFTSPSNPKPNPNSVFDSRIPDFTLETPNSQSTVNSSGFLPEPGTFTSLITGSNPSILGFNFSDLPFRLQQQKFTMVEELKGQELTAGFMDQTASVVDLPNLQSRTGNAGLTALDWQCSGTDSSLFVDLPSTVDPSYWNQSHWGEADPSSLYHLP